MSDTFDWRIIDRQLAGEASSADQKALRRWLAEDPRHAELVGALHEAAQSSRDAATEHWNVEAAWLKIAPSRGGDRARPLMLSSARRMERSVASRGGRWYAWGAIGVVAAAAVASLLLHPHGSDTPRRAPIAMRAVVTAIGQRTRVAPHGGTRVPHQGKLLAARR